MATDKGFSFHKMFLALVLFIGPVIIKSCFAECTGATYLQCESLEYFKTYFRNDTDNNNPLNAHEVAIIGSEESTHPPSSKLSNWELFRFQQYKYKILFIVNEVEDIKGSPHRHTCQGPSGAYRFEHLQFYKNTIRKIEKYAFREIVADKLSLSYNNIEEVEDAAFSEGHVEILDLSHNGIERIPSISSWGTKIINLGFNKIRYIASSSLPESTEEIYLDHNQLVILQDGLLKDLKKLKVLTLTNNQLSHISISSLPVNLVELNLDDNELTKLEENFFKKLPKLDTLSLSHNYLEVFPNNLEDGKNIRILNFSYNNITYASGLEGMDTLATLDLSYNKIVTADDLLNDFLIPKREGSITVHLHCNRIQQLSLRKDIPDGNGEWMELSIHGNPFDCKIFNETDSSLKRLRCRQGKCDDFFFRSGKTPFCVIYDNDERGNRIEDEKTENNFLSLVEEHKHVFRDCDQVVFDKLAETKISCAHG